jgi:restriction system protein
LLLQLPPSGFERLSQRLLRESGFTQVVVTVSSGDGGIDGYGSLQINQKVCFSIRCARFSWRNGRPRGQGHLTTGTFTAEARREASREGVAAIELLDGEKLVDMLERLELGLKPITTYEIDESFFKEFRG